MITQFRNLNFFNIFFLLALTLVLRIGVFINLPEAVNSGFIELFNRLLINFNPDNFLSPIANLFIATLLVFLQALLFNQMVNKYGILGKSTFLPAACYILACSVFAPFLTFTPPLLCNFFLLYIFNEILTEYKSNNSIASMYNLGLVVTLGTLFYFPFIIFLVLLWLALFVFKPFYWREWVSAFMGFITLIYLLGVYYYWNNKLLDFYDIWKPLSTKLPIYINIQVLDYIVLFPIITCVLLSMLYLRQNFFKSFVLVRKSFQLSLFILFLAVGSFYLKTDFRINHFLLCAIPVALAMSYYFIHAKKKWIFESLFLVIVSFIIYFQFV